MIQPSSLSRKDGQLGERTAKSGIAVAISQILQIISGFLATAFLTRLLEPEDFGIVQVASIITGFAALLSTSGLELPAIQAKSITTGQVNNLFWVSVSVGFLTFLLSAGFSPVAAWYFERNELTLVISASSLSFIFAGIGIQSQAMLKRNLEFPRLSVAQISSTITGQFIGVFSAWITGSYWSLVLMNLSSILLRSIFVFSLWPIAIAKPSREPGSRKLFGIGANLTGSSILNYFVRQTDNAVIASNYSEHELGIYSKAYSLLMLPITRINGPLTTITVPALAAAQDDPERFRKIYTKCLSALSLLSLPVATISTVFAEEVTLILLGDKFTASIFIFQLLIPAAFIGSLNVSTGWVFAALGQTGKQLRSETATSIVVVPAILIGATHGIEGVAIAVSSAFMIVRLPQMAYCFKDSPIEFRHFAEATWTPMLACGLAGILSFAFRSSIILLDPFLTLVSGVVFFSFLYTMTLSLFKCNRTLAAEIYRFIGKRVR